MQDMNEIVDATKAKPMELGIDHAQVEEISAEIAHTGVAENEADVERLATPGPETGEEQDTSVADETSATTVLPQVRIAG